MSTARALANQKLYHARILIDSWRAALGEEQVASTVLEQAFGAPVCGHLGAAYGWFLLEIAQPPEMPPEPPRCCADLPAVSEGRETPPEILEFRQLECEHWLASILDPVAVHSRSGVPLNNSQNLAVVTDQRFSPEEAARWHAQLNALFDRMTDSLDEY